MVEIFGTDIPTPTIDISGFLSSSWIYVVVVAFIGFIIIMAVALLLFFKTYNKRIVVFENISGQGYHKTLTTRARAIKIGTSGEEVLKTLFGGNYLTAYGRKMDKNTYWFVKALDGLLYNAILGDFDTKTAMLDIEPVDRDVRMTRVALDRLTYAMYDKKSFLEKWGGWMAIFIVLVILFVGFYIIVGQISNANQQLAEASRTLANALKSAPAPSGLVAA